MKNLLSFYNSEEKQLKNKLLRVKKNLKILSLLRLTVFILTVVSIYLLFENTLITTVILIVGGSSFYFLVVKYSNEKLEKNLLNCKIEINQTEITVFNGDFSFLPKGNEYLDSDHHYSHDIDLFGENSFFQYLNRTASSDGSRKLANLMTENLTSSIFIPACLCALMVPIELLKSDAPNKREAVVAVTDPVFVVLATCSPSRKILRTLPSKVETM